MSTELQRYSLASQAAAIAEFAQARGYAILRSYEDPGRSGLTLKDRPGLKRLLADVVSGSGGFSVILVLDVSRWGRFQDADQAAYYEYLCRDAGVEVVYCAEPFENDRTPVSAIVKQLKRVMAAEYSRELSAKVARALRQQASLGFRQGGLRPFGFRRVLVDGDGRERAVLRDGERKAMTSERVVIRPGPAEEVATLRRIFVDYVRRERGTADIANALNEEGVPAAYGRAWTRDTVRSVLRNELAVGRYIYNVGVERLAEPRRLNPPELVTRVQLFEPLVDERLFAAAGARLARRAHRKPDKAKLVAGLKRLRRERGYLNRPLIRACRYLPNPSVYMAAFGSMAAAYKLAGQRQGLPKWRGEGRSAVSESILLGWLRDLHGRAGYLNSRLIDQEHGIPSAAYYRRRFGSLLNIYARLGLPWERGDLLEAGRRHPPPPPRPKFVPRSAESLLADLRRLFDRHGYVSGNLIIQSAPEVARIEVYYRRFGSLLRAYELAGLPHDRSELMRLALERHPTMRLRRTADF
jgi:DNA invertase Pin-like site-specific DNA recombinase